MIVGEMIQLNMLIFYLAPGTRKDIFVDPNASIDFLKKSLELIGESPSKKKKAKVGSYTKKKIEKIKTTLEKHLVPTKHDSEVEQDDVVPPESEMLAQLKDKFSQSTKRSE
ncbi:hypothetical protein WA026_009051 [Henosepilachna vigintioctopunctata]|uniref:Uncharacterized protein n=1 Tax=Henosepilachna vigintioctopunctata TaxID=420089 RepID=A0AAW1UNT8_9CUCU